MMNKAEGEWAVAFLYLNDEIGLPVLGRSVKDNSYGKEKEEKRR